MDSRPQFDSRFLVGIEQVDREHLRIFEIAGRVHDSLLDGGAAALDAARTAVAELLDYTETHFASEEKLMEAAGYPELSAHRGLHRSLLAQARDMEMRVELGERHVPVELNRFITRWLIEHIEANDKKFGAFAQSRT
ncbi:MAG TPA: bacteriohemerythrin [Rhodocyclaceae bacterium]|nr:bacteriohemerythrin [Rhodocyclaceae bacterium]